MKFDAAPVDVTYRSIEGNWFLSLAGLRRFAWDGPPENAQALMVALALLLREAVRQDGRLRAGTELVELEGGSIQVLRHGAPAADFPTPTFDELCGIVRELGAACGWGGPLDVVIAADSVLGRLYRNAPREPVEEGPEAG